MTLYASQFLPKLPCLFHGTLLLRQVLNIDSLKTKLRITLEVLAVQSLTNHLHIFQSGRKTDVGNINALLAGIVGNGLPLQITTPRNVHLNQALHTIFVELVFASC